MWDETLTLEYAAETLAQYPIAEEGDGRHLRAVGEPRLYTTSHASLQPFLPPLAETAWHPVQRLSPYRPHRKRAAAGRQALLFPEQQDASTG